MQAHNFNIDIELKTKWRAWILKTTRQQFNVNIIVDIESSIFHFIENFSHSTQINLLSTLKWILENLKLIFQIHQNF